MTLEHIRIEFACAEGALRRVLGVIEARAFAVRSMQMGSNGDRSVITLALEPADESRRIDTLMRQLTRLHDVEAIMRLTNVPPPVREGIHAAAA